MADDRADYYFGLDRALTPAERRLLFQKTPRKNAGYAAPPGTGPDGETCRTCKHYAYNHNRTSRRYPKCALMEAVWTHGPGTDIKARSPACSCWERPAAPPETDGT